SNQDNNHGIDGPSSGHSSSLIVWKNCDRRTVKKATTSRRGFCTFIVTLEQLCVFSGRRKPGPVPKRAAGAPAPPRVRPGRDRTHQATRRGHEGGGRRRVVVHPLNAASYLHWYTIFTPPADVGAEVDHAGRGSNQYPQPTCEGGNGGRIIVLFSNGT
ncbi:unnamed protein product, partial [Ectocarpus sp. 8 AP-2014]